MTHHTWPQRFSWPMRLFLCCFIGDMVVRSLLSLSPYEDRWHRELHVDLFPKSLPTAAEFAAIEAGTHPEGFRSAGERLSASLASIGPYFSPVPSSATRAELTNARSVAKYAVTWVASRMKFLGTFVGVDQDWPMFSPQVANDESLGRLRLVFADGSSRIWHTRADPEDACCFSHWFEERVLQACTKVRFDHDSQTGYCNWVRKQVPANECGSPLVRIEVFEVCYRYPRADEDAAAIMQAEAAREVANPRPPVWIYDVARGAGEATKQ